MNAIVNSKTGRASSGSNLSEPGSSVPGYGGFSLLEVLGALAVAAILISALAAVTIRSIDRAFTSQEAGNLQNFANAFETSILRNRYIPGTNDWYQVIATELGAN